MKVLATTAEHARLLPGGSSDLFVVVFWRASAPDASAFLARISEISWPPQFCPVSIELDAAPEIAAWFDTPMLPMLAVVTDGAMLGMEYECSTKSCEALATCASRQYSMMTP